MKKVLVFLLLCLSSTMMFAANPPLHYQIDGTGCDPMQTTITGVFMVDGVEIYNGEGMQNQGGQNIEIGVFDQDGNCRGTKFPTWRNSAKKYIYQLQLRGNAGMYYPTFKVYDHGTESELDLVLDIDETIEWTSGGKYGDLSNLYAINFTHNAAGGYDLTITPYSGPNDHYYLISSPVGAVAPEAVTNMVAPYDFDLYYFNQSGDDEGKEWFNYKAEAFGLEAGKGYLYANAGDGENPTVTLTFPGNAYEGTGTFDLEFVDDEGIDWAGWNLVGNPFNATATVDREFYVINPDKGEVVPAEGINTVEPMQGIFVEATAPGQTVTFTVGEGSKVSKLALNLMGNNTLVDRAIVNFGEGSLSKFQIHSNSTKLYIPMDGVDYAVVSSAEMGELPVNFKTEKSGSYTLAVSSELSFSYLHLIDNKTGADIDLLATPSYSFEAQATDYASRFRLVFATGNSDDTFAFYSNGSFVISNEGDATVQVMDVTGRMLSSEAISGSASINVEGAAGVYMVRLVNGENVRVQKIIVK